VNLFAEIIDFDETLVDPAAFTYEWRRNGNPIGANYSFYSEVLNNQGTYNYEVRAYINNSLGCNAAWTAFDPVKVVAQPTVQIYPKDYNLYDVCVGAIIEINTELGADDATIQMGYQYKWNDINQWTNFTNQIDPRSIKFDTPGSHTYFLNATFANPTCNAATSNAITYKVVNDPVWTVTGIQPDLYDLCLGDIVTLTAEYAGGVTDGSNVGRIQWMYKFNDESYVNLSGVGGNKTHKPAQAGEYCYLATYIPAHELSGCDIDPVEFCPLTVKESITPSAVFTNNDAQPQVCANQPYVLYIEFEGTAPFHFAIQENPGGLITYHTSNTKIFLLTVNPSVTTIYTIESLNEGSDCVVGTFVKSNITVVVTDVEILTPYVEACGNTVDVNLKLNQFVNNEAVVTFPCTTPIHVPIVHAGAYSTITIPIPACAGFGIHEVIVSIDGCNFDLTIMKKFGADDNQQLIYRRWEGNAEVLAVSNNYDPSAKYYNGGFDFTSYQWYKNGVLIPGATKQYYQDPDGINGLYSVRLTGYKVNQSGNHIGTSIEFTTCDQAFNPTLSLKVYPVPAQLDEPVYVEIDLTPAEMEGAVLDIYDAKGAHIQHLNVVSSITEVTGFKAQGAYYGRITTGTNEIKAVRFLIVK
jgi:hypothetical protein